ncbi:MAG: hypothetical protein ACK41O_27055, partial [Runella zeae]
MRKRKQQQHGVEPASKKVRSSFREAVAALKDLEAKLGVGPQPPSAACVLLDSARTKYAVKKPGSRRGHGATPAYTGRGKNKKKTPHSQPT